MNAYIAGVSSTQFKKWPEKSFRDLVREAYLGALDDAGLPGAEIEFAWFGNCGMANWGQPGIRGQVCFSPLVEEGLFPERVPIVNVEGASDTFRGTIASYATDVKRSLLGVTAESVVSEAAAKEMAEAAQRVLGADVGIAATGVAGPTEQDGVAVGTVFFGIALPGHATEVVSTRLPGDRERLRQFSTISLLNLLRQRLDVLDRR